MATLSIRIDGDLKKETERNLQSMGLTFSSAINIFFTKINQTHKIPFEIEACPYDPEFVRMMDESLADYEAGRYISFKDRESMHEFIMSGGEDNEGIIYGPGYQTAGEAEKVSAKASA